jgi:hypothetical protein
LVTSLIVLPPSSLHTVGAARSGHCSFESRRHWKFDVPDLYGGTTINGQASQAWSQAPQNERERF